MTDNLKTWPERIYLQAGDDYELMPYEGMDGMSWCEHPIFNQDVQYVRADLIPTVKQSLTVAPSLNQSEHGSVEEKSSYIQDAMCDKQYAYGFRAGWNASTDGDEALLKKMDDRVAEANLVLHMSAPSFSQVEFDSQVAKGTQAWADPADYPERCKVDPLQSLADQAQAMNMGYDDVIDIAQSKRLITQLRARILELSKVRVESEPLEPWRDIANALPRLQAWRDGAGTQELGVGYCAGSDEFAYDVCSLLSAHKELLQIISAKDSS